jgi:hypothetical protein
MVEQTKAKAITHEAALMGTGQDRGTFDHFVLWTMFAFCQFADKDHEVGALLHQSHRVARSVTMLWEIICAQHKSTKAPCDASHPLEVQVALL